ncbi:hypothetical protein Q7689_00490 [Nocardiopsis tropica]|uniref:hypothetical protein n=1 Tax=Nocardiopsis tropica TaxID=109330 RepID=UPI002E84731B|nr:hypothetical protein [Nocardiopsis tropica]
MSTDTFEIEALDQPTFTQVGHWVAFRSDLSPTARHLYTVLATFVNQGRRANGDTDVWPSLNLLAVTLGLSKGESVTPYVDELIQADIVVKRTHTIGGMNARNTYAIRFNPPPGIATASSLKALLAPLKEIADDPKAMSKAAKDTRELIAKRREREKAKRTDGKGKTAGRAVPRKTGVRAPESRGTHPGKPGCNKTQVELDAGRTTSSSSSADASAEREPAPAVEKKTKKITKKSAEDIVLERLAHMTPTLEEADAVITLVIAKAAAKGIRVEQPDRWIDGRDKRVLEQDLEDVRRASKVTLSGECGLHEVSLESGACSSCMGDIKAGDAEAIRAHLLEVGADSRPDLVAVLGAPQAARVLDEGDRIRRMQKGAYRPYRNPADQSEYDAPLIPPRPRGGALEPVPTAEDWQTGRAKINI